MEHDWRLFEPAQQAALPPLKLSGTTLGARVREARKARDLSQEALAAPEFTKSYISAMERDKVRPSLKALGIIASRLGLTPAELLQVQHAPTDPEAVLGRAEALILAGEPAAALTLLDQQELPGHEESIESLRKLAGEAAAHPDVLPDQAGDGAGDLRGSVTRSARNYAEISGAAFVEGDLPAGWLALGAARGMYATRARLLAAVRAHIAAARKDGGASLLDARLLAELIGDPHLEAEVAVTLAEAAHRRGDPAAAIQCAGDSLRLEPSGSSAIRAKLLVGYISNERGAFAEAEATMQAALRMAEELGEEDLRILVASVLADVLVARGEHERATQYYRLAVGGLRRGAGQKETARA